MCLNDLFSRAHQKLIQILKSACDFVFPPRCCVCGKLSRGEPFLCETCQKKLTFFGGEPDSVAYHRDHPADTAVSLYYFDPVFQKLVHGLKYHDQWYFGRFMGREMGRYFSDLKDGCDVVVPVPLHALRRRERGYNQAEMIARGLGGEWGIPVNSRLLKRLRNTETQTHLDKDQRQKNMNGVFAVHKSSVYPEKICLVDDVFTTGATTMEAARTLKKAGVKHVVIVTAATPRRD